MKSKYFYSILVSILISLKSLACDVPANVNTLNNPMMPFSIEVLGVSTWDIEYGETGFVPTGVPGISGIVETWLQASELPTEMYLDFYVRNNCGTGNYSDWVGPYNFYNFCQLNFQGFWETESFEDGFLPYCWMESDSGTPTSGIYINEESSWEQYSLPYNPSQKGAKISIMGAETNDWLVFPMLSSFMLLKNKQLGYETLDISFNYALTQHNSDESATLGSDDKVQLLLSSDMGNSWHLIDEWNHSSFIANNSQYYQKTINAFQYELFSYNYLIAIWATSGSFVDTNNVDFFVDNVMVSIPYTGNVEDQLYEKGIALYPNPVENVLKIKAKSPLKEIVIFDSTGKVFAKYTASGNEFEINITELKTGIYYAKIQSQKAISIERLVKE